MLEIRNAFFLLLLVFALSLPFNAHALQNKSLPVNWRQDSIDWSQLQSLFSQNPGFNQFSIKFPNGVMWNVNPLQLQGIYNAYVQHAQVINLRGGAPELTFSSLKSGHGKKNGVTTIPINNVMNNMEAAKQDMLNQLDYQKYRLASYLPDWLKKIIVITCNGFERLWDFLMEKI